MRFTDFAVVALTVAGASGAPHPQYDEYNPTVAHYEPASVTFVPDTYGSESSSEVPYEASSTVVYGVAVTEVPYEASSTVVYGAAVTEVPYEASSTVVYGAAVTEVPYEASSTVVYGAAVTEVPYEASSTVVYGAAVTEVPYEASSTVVYEAAVTEVPYEAPPTHKSSATAKSMDSYYRESPMIGSEFASSTSAAHEHHPSPTAYELQSIPGPPYEQASPTHGYESYSNPESPSTAEHASYDTAAAPPTHGYESYSNPESPSTAEPASYNTATAPPTHGYESYSNPESPSTAEPASYNTATAPPTQGYESYSNPESPSTAEPASYNTATAPPTQGYESYSNPESPSTAEPASYNTATAPPTQGYESYSNPESPSTAEPASYDTATAPTSPGYESHSNPESSYVQPSSPIGYESSSTAEHASYDSVTAPTSPGYESYSNPESSSIQPSSPIGYESSSTAEHTSYDSVTAPTSPGYESSSTAEHTSYGTVTGPKPYKPHRVISYSPEVVTPFNTGINLAYFNNPSMQTGYGYPYFDTTTFKREKSIYTGPAWQIGFSNIALKAEGTLYPGAPACSIKDLAVVHTGFVYAREAGIYNFTLTAADEVVMGWIGTRAYDSFSARNADLFAINYHIPDANGYESYSGRYPDEVDTEYPIPEPITTCSKTLERGEIIPFKVLWANSARTNGNLGFIIEGPHYILLSSEFESATDVITTAPSGTHEFWF